MISKIISFLISLLVWCGLSWPLDTQDLVIGAAASLFVAYMTADLAVHLGGRKDAAKYGPVYNLKRVLWFLCYIAVFLWECVKANIDVAYRVLHPDLPIRPGTVKVKTNLKSDMGLTLLANSVTLTPGTTSVDIDREKGVLYVHWIYVKDSYLRGDKRLPVVEKFENILKKVFEPSPFSKEGHGLKKGLGE